MPVQPELLSLFCNAIISFAVVSGWSGHERELQREWLETVDIREGDLGIGNWSMMGVSHDGARISSSIIAKSCSSSSRSQG